eukprot:15124164-Alexandrium_andersonii.AAC.1
MDEQLELARQLRKALPTAACDAKARIKARKKEEKAEKENQQKAKRDQLNKVADAAAAANQAEARNSITD